MKLELEREEKDLLIVHLAFALTPLQCKFPSGYSLRIIKIIRTSLLKRLKADRT